MPNHEVLKKSKHWEKSWRSSGHQQMILITISRATPPSLLSWGGSEIWRCFLRMKILLVLFKHSCQRLNNVKLIKSFNHYLKDCLAYNQHNFNLVLKYFTWKSTFLCFFIWFISWIFAHFDKINTHGTEFLKISNNIFLVLQS